MKLNPYFSFMPFMALQLSNAGANGLILFNRFYQPNLDLENLEVVPEVILSTSHDIRLPLRWIAILYGHIPCSFAASGGIHTAEDVVKVIMTGADVAMLCSALLKNGISHLTTLLGSIEAWMEKKEYSSIAQMKGSMSQKSVSEPAAFERANYMKALHNYQEKTI